MLQKYVFNTILNQYINATLAYTISFCFLLMCQIVLSFESLMHAACGFLCNIIIRIVLFYTGDIVMKEIRIPEAQERATHFPNLHLLGKLFLPCGIQQMFDALIILQLQVFFGVGGRGKVFFFFFGRFVKFVIDVERTVSHCNFRICCKLVFLAITTSSERYHSACCSAPS